ncbi:hypothetical protein KKD19_06755 [Patescibacteria group bacterium]|nr:hypothetical protein [Patescibacteria group bacterium]MBU4512903.1 hypothetical protein [Patescibacteria group bacterium]
MKKVLPFALVILALLITSACTLGGKKPPPSYPGGVFKTFDAALTWDHKVMVSQIGAAQQTINDVNVRKLSFFPKTTKSLYLLPEGEGFYVSYNNGETWIPQLMDKGVINDLDIDPQNRGYIFVVVNDIVYRLEQCCDEWSKVYLETRGNILTSIAINPKNPQEVYFTTSKGELFKSNNHGDSWTVIKRLEIFIQELIINPQDQNIMYIIANQGIYKSKDKGITWNKIDSLSQYPGTGELYHFVFNPNKWDSFFYVSKYGILKTDDGGETWHDISLLTPPGAVRIHAFTFNPKNLEEMIYATANTLYKTADGGEKWETKSLPTKSPPTFLLTDPEHSNVIYLGTKTASVQ